MAISQNIVIVKLLFILVTFQAGIMAFLTSIHCCPGAHWSVQTKQRENLWTAVLKSASQWKPDPIWFSSHEENRIFIRHVRSPFHPNFDRKETHTTQHWIPHSFWMVYADVYKTWMEGTYDIPNKKSTFLCDYWTKSDRVLTEMQIISYIFIILKHIQVSFIISKVIDAESPIIIFGGDNLYR